MHLDENFEDACHDMNRVYSFAQGYPVQSAEQSQNKEQFYGRLEQTNEFDSNDIELQP